MGQANPPDRHQPNPNPNQPTSSSLQLHLHPINFPPPIQSDPIHHLEMGNICSRSANKPDNFSQPGRTLNSSPVQAPRPAQSRAPRQSAKQSVATPGRTLGGADNQPPGDVADARTNAAIAAQVSCPPVLVLGTCLALFLLFRVRSAVSICLRRQRE